MMRPRSYTGGVRPGRALLLAALLAAACGSLPPLPGAGLPPAAASQTALAAPTATPRPPTPTPTITITPATPSSEQAALTELAGEVQVRAAAGEPLVAAGQGHALRPGSQVVTGPTGRARLDLDGGALIRLGSGVELTVSGLGGAPPLTQLTLAAGELWAMLPAGALEVTTPAGMAQVQGGYLGVAYLAPSQTMVVTCLQGICRLATPGTDRQFTALRTGEAASLSAPAGAPVVRLITAEELQAWVDANPEAGAVLARVLPNLTPEATLPFPHGTAPGGTPLGPAATSTRAPTTAATRAGSRGATPTPEATTTAAGATQPLRYVLRNDCSATAGPWHVTFDGPASRLLEILPGQTARGELPPGRYTVTLAADNGLTEGPFAFNSDDGALERTLCPGPAPAGTASAAQPLRYSIANRCFVPNAAGELVALGWHWRFEGPVTVLVDVPAGETRTGELPAGRYTITTWNDQGPGEGPFTADSADGAISQVHCPG